jgi:hypothetical protein
MAATKTTAKKTKKPAAAKSSAAKPAFSKEQYLSWFGMLV